MYNYSGRTSVFKTADPQPALNLIRLRLMAVLCTVVHALRAIAHRPCNGGKTAERMTNGPDPQSTCQQRVARRLINRRSCWANRITRPFSKTFPRLVGLFPTNANCRCRNSTVKCETHLQQRGQEAMINELLSCSGLGISLKFAGGTASLPDDLYPVSITQMEEQA